MDIIRAFVERILRELGVLGTVAPKFKWELEEIEPDHHKVVFYVPDDQDSKSVSFSTSAQSNYDSIKADIAPKIQLITGMIQYKTYLIQAKSEKLESEKWSVEIEIMRLGHTPAGRTFSTVNTFPTREEAVAYCFAFGQEIIDGKVPDCSIEGL